MPMYNMFNDDDYRNLVCMISQKESDRIQVNEKEMSPEQKTEYLMRGSMNFSLFSAITGMKVLELTAAVRELQRQVKELQQAIVEVKGK